VAYKSEATLIQRFGACKEPEYPHPHAVPDGACMNGSDSVARFHWVKAPTGNDYLEDEPTRQGIAGF